MSHQELLNYYKCILPAPEQFLESCQASLPTCIWTNTLKISPSELKTLMEKGGYQLEPLAWHPSAFRVTGQASVGKSWQYLAGLFQIQEEVSMIPGVLLAPESTDKVLDLCAAPGNKTAQLSVAMKNQGTLVANDRNYGRMRALGQIMKRLSLMNISTTIYDGATYPPVNQYFDKVLVDAPCSCEGTFRKSGDKVVSPSRSRSLKMANVQFNLLKKAVKLVKPGGRIIYSTCTFAPEENERVVSRLLQTLKGEVKVVPLKLDNFEHSGGILEWQGEFYDASVKETIRVWPHQNNTGGFYVAMLEKILDDNVEPTPAKKNRVDQEKLMRYLPDIRERYAFAETIWQPYRFITESNRGIYITNVDNLPPSLLKLDATGLFFLKTNTRFPKLTTSAAMALYANAERHTVVLTSDQCQSYFEHEEIALDENQLILLTATGFVLVSYAGVPLGVGLYLSAQNAKPARLQVLFPRYL